MSIVVPILTEFKSDGINKAIDQFKSLEGAGQKAQFAIKKAAVPAAAALAGLGVALGDAVKGAIDDQKASTELARALDASAGATKAQIKQSEEWISSMGRAYGVADDQLRPALGKLVRTTFDVQEAQRGVRLAMDISAATGKDLDTVTTALSKAYGGNNAALAKLDPSLRDVIKAGASTSDVMQMLGETFNGAADAAAKTAAGGFQRFGVAMSEAKESVGYALLPVLEKVMPVLASLGDWAQNHTQTFVIVAGTIGGIAAAIVAVNFAMKAWAAAQAIATAAQWAFNAAMEANPIVLIATGIAALVAGLVLAYKHFEGFRNIVNAVGTAIKDGFLVWLSAIKLEADAVWNVFKFAFNMIAKAWNNTVGKLSFKIPSWVPGIGGSGFSVPNIPELANGGIVNSPTLALIGEAGPEAVVPLSRGAGMAGNTVTINVNGGDPEAIVNALRRYMNRYGNVPIRTVAP